MSDQQERAPAVRNILSEYKTRLIGRPVDGAKKSPTFSFTINEKNDVTIKAYSNIEGDRGNGIISGRGDITVLYMITALVRAAVATKGPFKRTVKHEDHAFIRGQRSERPMWQFDLDVVRDAGDSDVRLVLRSYNRKDLDFYFRPSDYHHIVDGDGHELSTSELSDGYAIGWCEMVEDLATDLLKDFQLRLYTETDRPTIENRPPSLVFGSIANNPRATVFTNIEQDQHNNKGMIAGKIDAPIFYTFAQMIGQAVAAPAGWRRGIKNFGHGPQQNGRRGEKVHQSTMVVGKDEQGVIYLAVLDQDRNRPNLQFALQPHRRYVVLDEQGNQLDPSRSSALMATVFKVALPRVMAKHVNQNYVAPDPSTWQNNNNGGGGQRQGGQQWGNRQGGQQGGGQQRQWGNNNNNQQRSGGGQQQQSNQSQQYGNQPQQQQHSNGGNPNDVVQQPQVLSRESAPMAFDSDIPF